MPTQPSAKLTGKRRGASQRSSGPPGPLILDPTRLGSVTLNREAIQALTLAEARVQITIDAGGTTAVLVSEETGKRIGGVDDLAKLMSLRSFVAKEKKALASSETREQIVTAAYRLSSEEVRNNPGYVQKHLDNSFIVAAKPYEIMFETVLSHKRDIEENFNTAAEWKELLGKYCELTQCVLVKVLGAMVRGEKEKGLLDSLSFAVRLPVYIRNKLVTKSLALTKDMDLSRVLFPSDPAKGLSLSVKEWREPGFMKSMGSLMDNSYTISTVIQNDDTFLELVGMTAEQFANKEDPRVQRIEKMRIVVVPPFEDHDRVLSLLEKQNFRGFALPATAMDQSKDRLANFCAVPLRAYAFSVRMAETIPDFFDRIFPVGTIKAPDDKLGNYAKQAKTAIASGVECYLKDILRGDKNGPAFMTWVKRECKVLPKGELDKKLTALLVPDKEGLEVKDDFTDYDDQTLDKGVIVDLASKPVNAREAAEVAEFEKAVFSVGKDAKKRGGQTAASVLRRETKTFLRTIAREHSRALADSMEAYFRGFYSEAVQAAACRIAEARFDEFEAEDDGIGSSADVTEDERDLE